jgi:hypothetical protein
LIGLKNLLTLKMTIVTLAADASNGQSASERLRSRHRLTRPEPLVDRRQVARRSHWDAGF